MPRLDLYAHAAREIRRGETRSFGELAAMAGSPMGARAAGRALRSRALDAGVPWQRVVRADGGLSGTRGALQLELLQREGARPRSGESVAEWTRRGGLLCVASYRSGRLYEAGDARLEGLDSTRLEGFASEAAARARRFTPEGRAEPRRIGLPIVPAGRQQQGDARALSRRLAELDWGRIRDELLQQGLAHVPGLLSQVDCDALLTAGSDGESFDRCTHMEAKGYGVGSYRYWHEPLPEPAETLRRELYGRLRGPAAALDARGAPFPESLVDYHARCRAKGQPRPASILISYEAGGMNHPHHDAYGDECFPVQLVVVLSRRGPVSEGGEFEGGDFVLWTERADGELEACDVPAGCGDAVLFAARRCGASGARVMHGMRLLRRGRRDALGIVFHLAK